MSKKTGFSHLNITYKKYPLHYPLFHIKLFIFFFGFLFTTKLKNAFVYFILFANIKKQDQIVNINVFFSLLDSIEKIKRYCYFIL